MKISSLIWYDDYKKNLHIGKIIIGLYSGWRLSHHRVDANNSHYFRLGRLAVRI